MGASTSEQRELIREIRTDELPAPVLFSCYSGLVTATIKLVRDGLVPNSNNGAPYTNLPPASGENRGSIC
jgi:hypothetical protein